MTAGLGRPGSLSKGRAAPPYALVQGHNDSYGTKRTGTISESSFSGKPDGLSFFKIRRPVALVGVVNVSVAWNGTKASVIQSDWAWAIATPSSCPLAS